MLKVWEKELCPNWVWIMVCVENNIGRTLKYWL